MSGISFNRDPTQLAEVVKIAKQCDASCVGERAARC